MKTDLLKERLPVKMMLDCDSYVAKPEADLLFIL